MAEMLGFHDIRRSVAERRMEISGVVVVRVRRIGTDAFSVLMVLKDVLPREPPSPPGEPRLLEAQTLLVSDVLQSKGNLEPLLGAGFGGASTNVTATHTASGTAPTEAGTLGVALSELLVSEDAAMIIV